ncbi:MAG: sigma 54-interacting transcriptional regulator [Planctomycetia bacterium]
MSRLLIIDNDTGNRLVLRSQLVDAGHDVVMHENGARGLVEARSSPFDAILVSSRLSEGIDGFEVVHRIKAMPECQLTPAILYSEEQATSEELARGYENGADLYLGKHELGALATILKGQMRQRRRCLELAAQVRGLQEALKRAGNHEQVARDGIEAAGMDPTTILKELATGRPDGVILVDDEGAVRYADRGACELFGTRIESMPLGMLAPASGLEAFVRDARTESRVGFRFDLSARRGRGVRSLSAVVVPLLVRPGGANGQMATRLVLLQDATRRRYAAERLKCSDTVLNGRESSVLLDAARYLWRPDTIPGRSSAVVALRNAVVEEAMGRAPVVIVGPRGAEQELVARVLHYSSHQTGPYISQRCGAMAQENACAELFGMAAPALRHGLLQHVVDGTLHLADPGELPLEVQEQLARWLETGMLTRQGGHKAERLDARLVVSIEGDPARLVQEGRLSERLYSLMQAHRIDLVPLDARREDIDELARAAVARHGAARGVASIDAAALSILRARPWPGDAKELEDVVRAACNHATTPVVLVDDLPRTQKELAAGMRPNGHASAVRAPLPMQLAQPAYARGELQPAPRLGAPHRQPRDWDISDEEPVSLDLYEKKALLRALDECGGDRLAAARLLKVGKSTLYRKLKRFDI